MPKIGPSPPYKILFLTHVLPYPLTGGARTRAYYVLRQLCKKNEVTLVSFVRDSDLTQHVSHLESLCKAVYTVQIRRSALKNIAAIFKAEVSGDPAIILRDEKHEMTALLVKVTQTQKFDIVHADQTSMAKYALFAQTCYSDLEKPNILLDQHNALYRVVKRQTQFEPFWLQILWKRESKRLARFEGFLCRQFDQLLTVTEDDKQALISLFSGAERAYLANKITTIPICIDPDNHQVIEPDRKRQQIIYLGTMFWPPNREGVLWFAQHVFPLIKREIMAVELVVAGSKPSREIKQLEGQHDGSIRITGFLEDPSNELKSSSVFIVPLHAGGGMRVKILDAWLWGIPIIATTIGAEGIDYREGEHLLIADDPCSFAEAVVRLLRDDDLNRKLRRNGRRWVEEKYDWRKVYPKLDEVYASLTKHGSY